MMKFQEIDSIANLPYWTESLIQVVIVIMFSYTFFMLWKDIMLYRKKFQHVMWMSALLALHSRRRNTVIFYIFSIWCCMILFFTRLPYNFTIKLFFLVGFISRLSAILRPPGILLLASSNSWNYKLITSVLRPRTLYQINYLLRGSPANSPKNFFDSMIEYQVDEMSNRYIVSDETWKTTVFPLLDLVPVIVIDATYLNEALAHELSRILEDPELLRKSLLFIPDGPFHMQNMNWRIDTHKFVKCENIDEIRKRSASLIRDAKKQI
jgi:hypothetical protein